MKMKPIKMDLQHREIIHAVDAVHKEAWSRELDIILTSGGKPYFIPSDTAIFICYKKEDRTEGCYDTLPDGSPAWKLSGNTLTIVLSDQVLTFPGRVMLTVVFAHAGTELCTFPIEVNVHPSAWNKSVNSEDYFNITRFLIAPGNAEIGQILQVASVDRTGKVTGLQAVYPEISAGGSITSEALQQAIRSYLTENPPAQGVPGKDGVSPTVTVSKSGKVTTLTITDARGTKTATINDGADGQNGEYAVPSYWQTALDKGVQVINTALCEAGRNKSAFLFYSDAHWNYGAQMAPTLLKYLHKHTGMTRTFFGGDIVNNEASDYDTMKYLWEWRNQLNGLPNHHSVVGNHDDGNSTNNLFSEQYVYGYLLGAEETPDMVTGDTGLYYYIDNAAEKTRYLCLDTAYKGVDSDQTAFITEALKTTPANWHIIVIAHIWYAPDYDQYHIRPIPITGFDPGVSAVITMLDHYNARTGEFSDCHAKVEFCIGGHVHRDYTGATNGGIPVIVVETDSQHIRSAFTYTPGTNTEASVNGIIANYNDHILTVARVGRGNSFTVNLLSGESTEIPDNDDDGNTGGGSSSGGNDSGSDEPTTYTNVLRHALAADGVSIYNADDTPGYKANTRWSQSSQAEQVQDGRYLTGWIPVSGGDVIRLKNMDTADVGVLFSNAPGITAGSCNIGNLLDSWYGVTDESGNLIQFQMVEGHSYIRISCGYIGSDSVITINEPIE